MNDGSSLLCLSENAYICFAYSGSVLMLAPKEREVNACTYSTVNVLVHWKKLGNGEIDATHYCCLLVSTTFNINVMCT